VYWSSVPYGSPNAARAAFGLPYGTLLQYTKDPIGDLQAGRYDALVRAELEQAGLRASS